jgi:hypothetical protein
MNGPLEQVRENEEGREIVMVNLEAGTQVSISEIGEGGVAQIRVPVSYPEGRAVAYLLPSALLSEPLTPAALEKPQRGYMRLLTGEPLRFGAVAAGTYHLTLGRLTVVPDREVWAEFAASNEPVAIGVSENAPTEVAVAEMLPNATVTLLANAPMLRVKMD